MISLEGEAVSVMYTTDLDDDRLVLIGLNTENVFSSVNANCGRSLAEHERRLW